MTAFAYDAASQFARFSRRWGSATNYEYDGIGRLAALQDGYNGGGVGDTRSTFLYNPASQVRSESRTNDSYAWQGSVAVNRGYTTNGQNQYTGTTSGATFGYDAKGNLISTVNAPWSTTYVYDAENRLLSASGTQNATLTYDPLGRLFQISSSAGTTQFLHDGDELVAEYNGSGTLLRRYIHGDSDDDPLYWYEGAGLDQPRFPHTNHQGSVIGTAGPGGALLGINTYDEYGVPGAGNTGRFQYTGQAWLPELGMYYYKARIYSPTLGRFLQTDPIGYDDQINLYAYVGNDPVNAVDPTGEEGCARGSGVCGFVRDFFVGDIEDAVAKPSVTTISIAVLTTVFKPAKIVDKVIDGAQSLTKAKRVAENVAKGIPKSRIGPSGKPRIHVRQHSSRKRAEDAAQSRTAPGQSPMEHFQFRGYNT